MQLNFVITGAPKSGTTYLDASLRSSKMIQLPRDKETNFFCSEAIDPSLGWVCRSQKAYEKQFKYGASKNGARQTNIIYGEVCPSYLYFPDRLIENFSGRTADLFIILRNPLRRAISHYFMDRDRFGKSIPPPELALTNRSATLYGAWGTDLNSFIDLSDYEKVIPKFQQEHLNVHMLFFEAGLKENLSRIVKRLGVKVQPFDGVVNEQRKLRSPLFRYLLTSAVFRTGYSWLGADAKSIISRKVYTTTDSTVYQRESNLLYEHLRCNSDWRQKIEYYDALRRSQDPVSTD